MLFDAQKEDCCEQVDYQSFLGYTEEKFNQKKLLICCQLFW